MGKIQALEKQVSELLGLLDAFTEINANIEIQVVFQNILLQMVRVGGPMITPHVIVQQIVKPGETVRISVSLHRKNYSCVCFRLITKSRLKKANNIMLQH